MIAPPLRLAWLRPAGPYTAAAETDAIVPELSPDYVVDLFDESTAHELVWRHARHPYDLCVHELADTPAHAFVWPYLFHYPGILRLRSPSLDAGRAFTLGRTLRDADYRCEVEFGGWDLLRAPVLASRLIAVSDELLAARLDRDFCGAAVRTVPMGVGRALDVPPRPRAAGVRLAVSPGSRRSTVERALARARNAGAAVLLTAGRVAGDDMKEADVVVAADWPPSAADPPVAALEAMSLAKAVVVLETRGTARWPALDPQTWQPRALAGREPPIVISIDPRDEEHSLVLVMRRLAGDPALVDRLAVSGHAWWREHATVAHAAAGWRAALADALSLAPPSPPPPGWPRHLLADGTQHARRLLEDLDVEVDFLRHPREERR